LTGRVGLFYDGMTPFSENFEVQKTPTDKSFGERQDFGELSRVA
jgi:hypothetical protein